MVLLSYCVIKHNYCGKYHRIAVNNPDKVFITLAQGGKHKYRCNLPQYFSPIMAKITMVIYHGILYNIGTRAQCYKKFYHGNV
jgi:hypothetical protein